MNTNELAFFGARAKILSLLKEKRSIDQEISELKKFLKSGEKAFVKKVRGKYKTRMTKIRRRKISSAGLEAMRKNAAKARAAKLLKNGHK